MTETARSNSKTVNLALQGGGSHGAFTWGVLDMLLEDGRLAVEGLTGTSAGAINACALVSGMEKGGAEEARATLRRLWRAVSRLATFAPLPTPLDKLVFGNAIEHTPGFMAWDVVTRFLSPYDFNPLDINPLRDVIRRQIDFDAVHRCERHKLFITATNVHTGKARVFSGEEVTPDAVMASACLPLLYQAVEIDGEPYWDGGFMGNPAIYPLHASTQSEDIVIVSINPLERPGTPRTAREILDRMNEITFNASLLAEYRAIEFVQRLLDQGKLPRGGPGGYKRVRVHRIPADEALKELSASSKYNADWGFLTTLRDAGRQITRAWLDATFEDIGVRDTVDLRREIAPRQIGREETAP